MSKEKMTELPVPEKFSSEKPTDLYLDIARWRCGGESNSIIESVNKHGKGKTHLLNKEGAMCCLGQFSLQLGIPKKELLSKGEVCEIVKEYHNELITNNEDYDDQLTGSCFSYQAMNINDRIDTTIESKVEKLTALCKREKVTLHIIDKNNILQSPPEKTV